MEFNKESLRKLNSDILEALRVVEKKHEVKVSLGGGRYSDVTYTLKLEVQTNDKGALEEKAKKDWDLNCSYFDFKKGDFKAKFEMSGETYTVEGFMPRRSKYNLLGVNVRSGKRMLFVADEISRKLHPELKEKPKYDFSRTV